MALIKEKSKKFFIIYTLIFSICCLIIFYVYYANGLSFIYDGDGWSQHYKALIYYSDYLKEIFRNLFINHKLVIPQWNFSIGEGFGVIETFNYYVIGDPIAFLCVFIPTDYIYIFYNASIILRLYLAGICFSYLCFYFKKDNYYAILGGSICYSFCLWALFNANRHIYFLNPLIYLPLVIVGVEKIINNEKPYLFVFSVTISALSNFYFFYNIVLLTVIYVAVRLLLLYIKDIKQLLIKLLIIFKYAIISVLISSVILLPVIYVFLNDTRALASVNYHLYYSLTYYLKLPSTYLSTTRNYWLCMGFAAPTLLCAISNILNIKNNKTTSILLIISVIIVLCPLLGQIFNGFSYISNKWCFSLALLISYIFVEQFDKLKDKWKIITIIYAFVIVVNILFGFNINTLIPLTIGLLFMFVTLSNKFKYKSLILVLLVAINVCFIGIWQYTSIGTNYSECATTIEDDKNIKELSEANLIKDLNDDEFFRYSGSSLTENASLISNTNSTDYYWSLTNGSTSRYRNDLAINEYSLYHYQGYDQRASLYSLANVKYYVIAKNSNELIPYNFTYLKTIDNYDFYINNSFIPFGYTYDNCLSYESFSNLNPVEKEEALTKYFVYSDGENKTVSLDSQVVNTTISEYKGLEICDNKIIVNDNNAYMILNFDGLDNSELYFSIEGLDYKDNSNWINGVNTSVTLSLETSNGIIKDIDYSNADNRYYNGRNNFTAYLGYSDKYVKTIKVSFNNKGTYTFDNYYVTCLPTENYDSNLQTLAKETLQNVKFDVNTVSGEIDLKTDKYLLLSIPYTKGWKAYVDGKEVELLNANDAYCGLKLLSGHHEIKLVYNTLLLKEGLIISVASLFVFIIIEKRKCKYQK